MKQKEILLWVLVVVSLVLSVVALVKPQSLRSDAAALPPDIRLPSTTPSDNLCSSQQLEYEAAVASGNQSRINRARAALDACWALQNN